MNYGWYNFSGASPYAGQGSYFKRDDDGVFDFDDHDFMVEFWVRTTAASGNLGIISKREDSGNGYGFEVHLLNASGISFYLKSNSGAAAISDQSMGITGLNDGEWHHIIVVFDRDSNARAAKDGVYGGTPVDISSHDNASINGAGALLFGVRHDLTQFFTGDITSPRIYDFGIDNVPGDLLTLIQYNYDNPGTIHPDLLPHLVEYWEWDKNPSLVGTEYNGLQIGIPAYPPAYKGGKLAYDVAELLLYQFRNAANIRKLLDCVSTEIQELRYECNNVQFFRALELAYGDQLDSLGDIVGEEREGRDDDEYREAIYFRILVNSSKAIPEDVISACKIATKANNVLYLEIYPAKVQLITDGGSIPNNLLEIMEAVAPVAVGIDSILGSYGAAPMFYWRTEFGAQKGRGFSELNTTTGNIYWYGGKLAEVIWP